MNEVPYQVQMKSNGIAVLLSFFFTGAGQVYADAIERGIVQLVIYFVLTVLSWITGGVFFIILLPYWVWGMFDANMQVDAFNSRIRNRSAEVKRKMQEDVKDRGQFIYSADFVSQLEKLAKLHDVNILSDDEYASRKKDLIVTLVEKRLKDQAEDFLAALVPSIKIGRLTETEIDQIKNLAFAQPVPKTNSSYANESMSVAVQAMSEDEIISALAAVGYNVSPNGTGWAAREPLGGRVKLGSIESLREYAQGKI